MSSSGHQGVSPKQSSRRGPGKSLWTPGEICRRLRQRYGPVEPPEPRPVLDTLILTILSQHTSKAGCRAAFHNLRQWFPHWEAVRQASAVDIAEAIRPAGLAQQRAQRIHTILQKIEALCGELSLEFLHTLSTEEAWEFLTQFPGVGPKTAACVLLFACGRPVLPVDTHVHRAASRLGLIPHRCSASKAQEILARRVPARWVLEFHLQLIRHGRQTCLARQPRCGACPLSGKCFFRLGKRGNE